MDDAVRKPSKMKMTPAALRVRVLGGRARVDSMSPEELSAANRKAAVARWSRLSAEERKAWRAARDRKAQAKREGKTTVLKRRS